MSGESGDMITTTPNNDNVSSSSSSSPSSLSLSSARINSLALPPTTTELGVVTDLIQSNLESSEGSEFGSNRSMGSVNGLLAAAREGFRLMRTDRNFQGLVYEISTDTNVWSSMQGAAMRNRSVQNYINTGDVSGFVHQHFITAEKERYETESAGTGLWATIWQIVEVVFLGKCIWDMIKGMMEKLFGGEVSGSVDVDLDVESRRMRLQLALLVTILIYMGVIAMRIALI